MSKIKIKLKKMRKLIRSVKNDQKHKFENLEVVFAFSIEKICETKEQDLGDIIFIFVFF